MRQADYATRIERAVTLIGERIGDQAAPALEELAAAAALSPHHFHRVFRLMTGETVAQTVRRMRVAAGLRVVEAGGSVTAAAQDAAYGSSQSFARAVRATVGQSVSALRATGTTGAVARSLAEAPNEDAPIAVELVSVAPFRVVATLRTGDYATLNLGYRALFESVAVVVGPEAVAGVYGVPLDDPRDVAPALHRFLCCLDVGERDVSAEGVERTTLGGGQYAVRRCTGHYDAVPDQIDGLYRHAITQGWELADRPVHLHYVDQPSAPEDAIHRSDIYLPIAATG